ncbi:MAG: hypothetical protein ACI4C5_03390 [Lachnospiraceae bacterium]
MIEILIVLFSVILGVLCSNGMDKNEPLLIGTWIVLGVLCFIIPVMLIISSGKKDKLDVSFEKLSSEERMRIDEECLNACRFKNAVLCKDGILLLRNNIKVLPMKEVVWVYGKNIHYRVGYTPVSAMTTSTIQIKDKNKKEHAIDIKIQAFEGKDIHNMDGVSEFMKHMYQNAPWAVYGVPNNFRKTYHNFDEMIQLVEKRRIEGVTEPIIHTEEEEEFTGTENVLKGIAGAVLGTLVGVALMVWFGEYENKIWLAVLFTVVLSLSGYGKGAGIITKKAFPICMIIAIPMIYLGEWMAWSLLLGRELDMGIIEAVPMLSKCFETGLVDKWDFWAELIISYFVALLTFIGYFIVMWRKSKKNS